MPMGLSLPKHISDILDFNNIFEVSGSIQYFTGSVQEDQPPYATLGTHIFQGKKSASPSDPYGMRYVSYRLPAKCSVLEGCEFETQ